jgi:hypothetical protein
MAKATGTRSHKAVVKRTAQGGRRPKTSGFSKSKKMNIKVYRGQGR